MPHSATAYHVAGHAVAAWRLGVKVNSISIVPDAGSKARLSHANPLRGINVESDGSDRAMIRAEKVIMVCVAGPIAQRRFNPHSWRLQHGKSDFDAALEIATRFAGSPKIAEAHLRYLQLRTEGLITNNWHLIEAVADAVIERGSMKRPQLIETMQAALQRRVIC